MAVRWLVVMADAQYREHSQGLPPSSSSLVTLSHALSSLLPSRASPVTLDVRGLEGIDEFVRRGEGAEEKLASYQLCVVLGCSEIMPWELCCTSLVCLIRCWMHMSRPLFCEATGTMLVWHVVCSPVRLTSQNLILLDPDEQQASLTAKHTQKQRFLLQSMTGEILERATVDEHGKEHKFIRHGNAGIRKRRSVMEQAKRMLAIRAGRAVEQHWLMARLLRFFASNNSYKLSTPVRSWFLNVTLGNSERSSCEMSFEAFQGIFLSESDFAHPPLAPLHPPGVPRSAHGSLSSRSHLGQETVPACADHPPPSSPMKVVAWSDEGPEMFEFDKSICVRFSITSCKVGVEALKAFLHRHRKEIFEGTVFEQRSDVSVLPTKRHKRVEKYLRKTKKQTEPWTAQVSEDEVASAEIAFSWSSWISSRVVVVVGVVVVCVVVVGFDDEAFAATVRSLFHSSSDVPLDQSATTARLSLLLPSGPPQLASLAVTSKQVQARMMDTFFRDHREQYRNPLPFTSTSLHGKELLPADFKRLFEAAEPKAAIPKLE
eukprot:761777-Hanusia_phi.AAC.2